MHAPTQNVVWPEPGSRRGGFHIRPHGGARFREIIGQYPAVQCRYFVVMPNHFHALVEIERARADMESAPTIISIVQAFKRYSTVEYIRLVKCGQAAPFDKHLWQRSFHDHVIRNETDYRMIAEYIQSNPRLWHKDCFYEEPPHEP